MRAGLRTALQTVSITPSVGVRSMEKIPTSPDCTFCGINAAEFPEKEQQACKVT